MHRPEKHNRNVTIRTGRNVCDRIAKQNKRLATRCVRLRSMSTMSCSYLQVCMT